MRATRRSVYRSDEIASDLDTAVSTLTGGDPDRPDVQAALLAAAAPGYTEDADAIAVIVSGDGTAALGAQLASVKADATAAKADLDDAAAAASGASAGTIEVQSALLKSKTEGFKTDIDALIVALGGSAGPVETNLAEVLALIGSVDITIGPEGTGGDADTAPLALNVLRGLAGDPATGLGPFELLVILTNVSTGAILQTSAFTLTDDGAGSVAQLDTGGTDAIYVVTTDVDGVAESLITDVAGASGIDVRATVYLKDGNAAIALAGTENGSVSFGGA